MCSYPEEKGGLSQWENSKFSPEMDHMMRQPGDAKNHYHHQHSLCCLREGKENTYVWWTLKESALNLLQNYYLEGKKRPQQKVYWEVIYCNIYYWFHPLPVRALFCIVNYCKKNPNLGKCHSKQQMNNFPQR